MEMINGLTMFLIGMVIGFFGYSRKVIREAKSETDMWRQSALDLTRELKSKEIEIYS